MIRKLIKPNFKEIKHRDNLMVDKYFDDTSYVPIETILKKIIHQQESLYHL